ncbi:MAG: hydroxyacylglutathione hydrolase [Saprospiraceae bacterium]|jgi:hydroxyacylglutathione hydrolase
MENFVYLIEDPSSQRCAVVDPAWNVQKITELSQSRGLTISDILLTHSHDDHINGINGVLDSYDAQVHLLHDEAKHWGEADVSASLHHGGDVLTLGNTDITLLHTPGHTPGSACFQVNDELLTGDTMFVFGCGRCDMHGGDPEVMFNTLNKMRSELPSNTLIRPGHNYAIKESCTLHEQSEGNPFMHFHDQEDFVKFRMQVHGQVRSGPYDAVSQAQAKEWLA